MVLVAGPAITYALLRNSHVQTFLVQRVASYLSKELDTKVEVGGLDVSFFLNIVLKDVSVEDRQGHPMIETHRMVFDIGRISFRQKYFLINKLYLEEAFLALRKYEEEEDFNFRFFVDYFEDDETRRRTDDNRWNVVCKSLDFSRSHFIFENQEILPKPHGFDINHLHVEDLNIAVHNIKLEGKQLIFHLSTMSFREPRGFSLHQLSGDFTIGPEGSGVKDLMITTPKSRLVLDADLAYSGYEAFRHFYDEVEIALVIGDSRLNISDLGFYLPAFYGMTNFVELHGEVTGRLSDLHAERFNLAYGSDSRFNGSFRMTGLPDPDMLRFNFFVDNFSTSINDITGFRLPASSRTPYLILHENIFNLGKISFRGNLSGKIQDFYARGMFGSELGDVQAGLELKADYNRETFTYRGDIDTQGFDLGSLVASNGNIGQISLKADIEGSGTSPDEMEVRLSGKINKLAFQEYDYQNIDVSGTFNNRMFNGDLKVDDPNLRLDFLGMISFEESIPVFDFSADIGMANLTALNLYQRAEEAASSVSAKLNINASGSGLDDLQGNINITDIHYQEAFEDDDTGQPHIASYVTRQINILNTNFGGDQKHLLIRSDFVDVSLSGEVFFADLLPAVRRFLGVHLPVILQQHNGTFHADSYPFAENRPQNFQLKVLFKDTELLSDLFFPAVRLSRNSVLYVDFDSDNDIIDITGRADQFALFGNRFYEWSLLGSMSAGGYQITNQSARLHLTDSLFVDNFCLDGLLYSDTLWYEANWRSWEDGVNSHGHIQGVTEFLGGSFARMRFLPSYAIINNSRWEINTGNEIYLDAARIEINNLVFYNGSQTMMLDGILSPDPAHRMQAFFHDFSFSHMDAMLNVRNMNFGGSMDGNISFTALYQQPTFEAALQIDSFAFNNEHLGNLTVQSVWDEEREGFRMSAILDDPARSGGVKPLHASGFFYPARDDDHFDIDILLDRLPLSIWSRYLDGILDGFHGFATGRLRLDGHARDPGISGTVFGDNAGFRVDYLNTSYSFSHQVILGKNSFSFDNLSLNDTYGNSGLASGTIRHNGYKNFNLDVLIRPDRMVVMNTNASHNELYYGRAFATGILHIHGPEDDIVMDVSARTNRGTQIFLPLTYSGEIIENNFITFVSRDTTVTQVSFPTSGIAGLTLNFDLDVSPDAEVQLIFDSQIGDVIRGRGSGNLKLEITSQGVFNMYGEYVIQEGDYLFTLQNLINKRFRIEQGGVIRWTGDPNEADIDLRAAYRLRTSLFDLMMDVDTSDFYRRRVPVECILILKDNLINPSISFDIHLPGGDEGTREMIERRITTEQEMNRQIFSLLVLNRFMPATTYQYNTALGYGVGSTSSELLSNQLSNWLSQISSEFDIGVNYRPGDQLTSQELEVALSTQLFDDRVLIDGNLGVAGTNPALSQQRTSNIVGDVNIEVKITPEGKFRIKAFNRSNTFDVLHTTSLYTQGVGIFYRKEFDSLSELFRRSFRSVEIPDPEEEEELPGDSEEAQM